MQKEERGFGSRFGFMMSLAGFCIGISNLWKFPYVVGANGGGAFLIIYYGFVIALGIPLFWAEIELGRKSQLSPVLAMRKLEGKKKTKWSLLGWCEILACFLITGYAFMVGAWALLYVGKVVKGTFRGMDSAEISEHFTSFSGSWEVVAGCLVMVIFISICLRGSVKNGLETICKYMMPLLLVMMMIILAIYANTLPGASEGLKWYLVPDFSKVTLSTVQAAAQQVFFSIGVGMLSGFVFGSYTKSDTPMCGDTALVAIMDSLVATLSGLALVPALFAFGIEPGVGASLIFVTLPELFNAMGGVVGIVFGVVFMVAFLFASVSSLLGLTEAMIACVSDATGWARKKCNYIICGSMFVLGAIYTMSQGEGLLSNIRILGMDIFNFGDFIASAIGLTLGGILILEYVVLRWGFDTFREYANEGSEGKLIHIGKWMKPYYNYVLPALLLFVVITICTSYIL